MRRPPRHSPSPRPRAGRTGPAAVAVAVLCSGGAAGAQPEAAEEEPDWEARVEFTAATAGAASPAAPPAPEDWTLDYGPPLGEPAAEAPPGREEIEQAMSDLWMLRSWRPREDPLPEVDGVGAEFRVLSDDLLAEEILAAHTSLWATGLFSRDAELLTPFAPGRELVSWDLNDRVSLSSVGSRRVWDYRDRAFILAAEAGFQFSHRAGLHVGYEMLQASADGGLSGDIEGEALFARFQLRF